MCAEALDPTSSFCLHREAGVLRSSYFLSAVVVEGCTGGVTPLEQGVIL